MKEVFRELLVLTCHLRYCDIKCINNPLTYDGRVALYDLDEYGIGLLGEKPHGLFRLIPSKWYNEFFTLAKEELAKLDLPSEAQEVCIQAIANWRAAKEEKLQKRAALQSYYTSKDIKENYRRIMGIDKEKIQLAFSAETISQSNPQLAHYAPDMIHIAHNLLEDINGQFKQKYDTFKMLKMNSALELNMKVGRVVDFDDCNLYASMKNQVTFDYAKLKFHILPIVLSGLKQMGYIFSYTINNHDSKFSIIC